MPKKKRSEYRYVEVERKVTCEDRLSRVCGSVEQEALEEVSSTDAETGSRTRKNVGKC